MSSKKSRLHPSRKAPKHKNIQRAFAESQQLFYNIFYHSPAAIVLSRLADGRFVQVNPSFLALTGYALNEAIGLTSTEAGITTDPEARARTLAAMQRGEPVPDFEVEIRCKSGEIRTGLVTLRVVSINNEKFILNTFIDITARKHAERELVQMKRLYATLSQVNQTIVRVRNQNELFQSICDVAVQFGEFSLAWVGLLDQASGEIRPVAATGLDVADWPFPIVNINQRNDKDGLAAAAIRTDRVVTSENIQTDIRTQKQHDRLRGFEFYSSAVVPLHQKHVVTGILGLVSNEANLFNAQEEIHLLEEMGLDISFALDMMEVEAARMGAELKLIKSEERFRTAFDNMIEGTQIIGSDWRYRYLNQSAEIHNHRPNKELLGNIYMEMWPGIEATHVFSLIKSCMEEHIPYDVQNEFIYPDKTVGWFDLKIQPIPNGVLILSYDITERKRIETARDQLARIVDTSDDAILSKTLDGVITSWNGGAEKLYGYSAEEAIGRSISLIIPPDHPDEMNDILECIKRGEYIEHYETLRVRKDGKKIDVSITVSPIRDNAGNTIGASSIAHDISERKRMDEQLQTSERTLKLFVEYAPAAIAMFDRDMRYIAASRRFAIDYDIGDRNIIGVSHYEIFPEIPERWKEIHRRCQAGATESAEEDAFPRVNGKLDWIRWEIRPWFETTNKIGGVILFSEVITERKQAQEAIRESQRQMNALVTSLDDIVFEFDAQATYLNVWTANENLLTNPRSELLGQHIGEILGDEREIYFKDAINRVLTSGQPERLEFSLDVISGKRWFRAAISPINVQGLQPRTVSMLIRDITESKHAEKKIQDQLEHLQSLREIDTAISSSFNLKMSLNAVVSQAVTELNIDAADILVLNPETAKFEYQAGWGFSTSAVQSYTVSAGHGLAGHCAQTGQPVYIRNLQEHASEFIRKTLLTEEKFVGYYCIPLINKMEVKGILEIFHHSPLEPEQEWVDFLHSLAAQAAIAIENATLFEGLQHSNMELAQAYDATIVGWSRAMDLRDKETAGHTQRVTDLTLELANAMGVGNDELIHIRRGALLHDMGKLGIPDDILLKPGKLTDEEWVIMRKHPQYAYDMLAFIQYLRPALDIPYCHHEKWDGTGYPRGLRGDEIPLAARLFAVVDVWDALCSDRPYRPGWPQEKVLEHIRAGSGTHFDPQAVELFLQIISEKLIA